MLNVFQHELQEEQSKTTTKKQTKNTTTTKKTSQKTTSQTTASLKNLPHISDNISNINVQKVRDAVLTWHNEERASV